MFGAHGTALHQSKMPGNGVTGEMLNVAQHDFGCVRYHSFFLSLFKNETKPYTMAYRLIDDCITPIGKRNRKIGNEAITQNYVLLMGGGSLSLPLCAQDFVFFLK
jgi:hypothetical protein